MEPIITKASFQVSQETLWEAITHVDRMTQWFFENIPDFRPELGFRTKFPVSTGERTFTHLWAITEVIPVEKITYHWSYEEYEGAGTVIFQLSGTPEGSQLTVTSLGMESFPQDIPEFKRESCQGGWDYFIKERLAAFLKD